MRQAPIDLLILKNGNVLSGVVHLGHEKTTVELANGSKLVIATDDVATICANYDEAFDHFQKTLADDDVSGHEGLYRWCIRFKQLALAERQLSRLQLMDLTASQLLQHYRLLDTLRVTETHSPQNRLASANTEFAPSTRSVDSHELPSPQSASWSPNTHRLAPLLPSGSERHPSELPPIPNATNGGIETVSYEIDATSPLDQSPPAVSLTTLTVPELELALAHVPDFGKQSFKKLIEPILIRNCQAAGCHHQYQPIMPLFDAGRGKSVPKRMSQQNIYQAMRYVGATADGTRPLVQYAITRHGPQEKAAIEKNTLDYQLLSEWVELMSGPTEAAKVPQRLGGQQTASAGNSKEKFTSQDSGGARGPVEKGNGAPVLATIPKIDSLIDPGQRSTLSPSIPQLNPLGPENRSVDPFDPTPFNQSRRR